jgi:hypothetical protein
MKFLPPHMPLRQHPDSVSQGEHSCYLLAVLGQDVDDWPGKVHTKHAENMICYRIPTVHTVNKGNRISKVSTK